VFLMLGALVFALAGGPLFVAIALGTLGAYMGVEPMAIDGTNLFVSMGALLDKPHLLPIVLFIFTGYMLAHSGTPKRAVRLAEAIVGWIPGGLAIVAVITCAFFTSFTGASGVTIIAIGGLLYPILIDRGYPERFNLGVLTASGSLGLLFFPSLPVFIVATVYSLSTTSSTVEPEAIFAAGLLPGILLVLALSLWAIHSGVVNKVARTRLDFSEVMTAARGAIWEVLLPVFLILAFQFSIIGIHEVATFLTFYVFIMEVFLYRDIHLRRDMPRLVSESMALAGAIVIILAVVLGMNNYLKDQQIPQQILAMVQSVIDSPLVFLIALNVFLLIVGCLMDVFSATVAVLPLIIPLAESFGIHPLHLCIIFLTNLEIGYLTPPVGLNLFISAFHFRKPVFSVYRAVIPAIGILMVCLAIITYVPTLSLALPAALDMTSAAAAAGDGAAGGGSGGPGDGSEGGALLETDSDELLDLLGDDDDDDFDDNDDDLDDFDDDDDDESDD
jgi:tripartite ATP-independent transporter DctM subunit